MIDWLFDLVPLDDVEIDSADDLPAAEDLACNDIEGVEDGIFEGDNEELGILSEAGMVDGTDHIDAEDIVRNPAVRAEFLSILGYDSTPEGYEVHHIIPLSEGGTDDISNMVLLEEDDHAQITAEHSAFYDWKKEN